MKNQLKYSFDNMNRHNKTHFLQKNTEFFFNFLYQFIWPTYIKDYEKNNILYESLSGVTGPLELIYV